MPAAREMNGSTCSVEMEDEWKREERESMSGWGSPNFSTVENEEEASEKVQRESYEDHGAHFNFAYFGVSLYQILVEHI